MPETVERKCQIQQLQLLLSKRDKNPPPHPNAARILTFLHFTGMAKPKAFDATANTHTWMCCWSVACQVCPGQTGSPSWVRRVCLAPQPPP